MKTLTRFQHDLIREYNKTRKQLRSRLKHRLAPEIVKAIIEETIKVLTKKQAIIIAKYIYREYKKGLADAKREFKGVEIKAAAHIPEMGSVGMDLSEVSQQQMNRIFHNNLGAIGNYNEKLSKTLQHQYNLLLNDNKLIKSLDTHGFTPWLEREWQKRGIDPAVIKLIKGQKTSKQMVNILELHGIKGGKHPNEVAKMLVPHINRFFGPDGVSINNIGKTVKRFTVDADGNHAWGAHKITRKYNATPRTYSRLIARDTLRQARMDAYYDSLKSSKHVDHYISVAHMDSTTCGMCASMHGRTVTKGSGPLYHGNCGCDLRPVWKKDSVLAKTNKLDAFYEKQRNTHFLRMDDLKRYNAKMPRGMKLKYATQLPEDAITKVMPGKAAMRKIRHEMLGKPAAITPSMPVTKPEVPTLSAMNDKKIANELWKKTAKDGKEHAVIRNGSPRILGGDVHSVNFNPEDIPKTPFELYHTHPNWDSPPSISDISFFLTNSMNKVMVAVSDTNIYKLTKMKKTRPVSAVLEKTHDTLLNSVFSNKCRKYNISIGRKNELAHKLYYESCVEVNKKLAYIYDYKFEVIKR